MEIDLVYPLGTGSQWDDNELRYSLRSVEKHLKNYANIYIVGHYPDWLKNARHIPAEDLWDPSRNIMEKILKACRTAELSERFLFMNDDFFFTQPVDAPTYPNYYNSTIEAAASLCVGNWYREYLTNTYRFLKVAGSGTKNFDIHTPIVYDKEKFIDTFSFMEFHKMTIKSIYANFNISDTQIEIADTKLRGHPTKNEIDRMIISGHIFSTSDWSLQSGHVKDRLNEMFPNPSKYEI